MSISFLNSGSGLQTIFFNSQGGSNRINMFKAPLVGFVSAYSYIVPTGAFNSGAALSFFSTEPAGSNVYFAGEFQIQTATPRSFTTSPALYSANLTAGVSPTPYLLKYNGNGAIVGLSNISPGTNMSAMRADPASNVYVVPATGGGSIYNISTGDTDPVATGVGANYNIMKYSPSGAIIAWGGVNLAPPNKTVSSIDFDAGSNVYITGTYKSATSVAVYNINGTPGSPTPTTSVSFPPTITPLAGTGSTWPYLLKYGPDGIFKGYTLLRVQGTAAGGGGAVSASSGSIYWVGGAISNIFANVNSISTTEPTTNLYSLNTTNTGFSNAFIIKYDMTGALVNFTEWGDGGGRNSSAGVPVITSSGSFFSQGSWAGGTAVPLNNFGLANPGGTSPTYLPKSSVFAALTPATGNEILVLFNSSGVVQGVSQHRDSVPQTTGSSFGLVIDRNDNIYQAITTGNITITFYNIGNTSSGVTVPANGQGNNVFIVRFNSSGTVTGYTVIPGSQTNSGVVIGSDPNYVYVSGIFINNSGASVSNISSIASTPVLYTELPTSAQRSPYFVKWKV